VNLRARVIEVHTDPTTGGYTLVRRMRGEESLSSAVLPELRLTVDEILG
jgi:Uma2 family endonuclease